jgi:hypothetical protein
MSHSMSMSIWGSRSGRWDGRLRARRIVVGLSSVAVALLAVGSVAGPAGAVAKTGHKGSAECSADFFSGDRRLGPAALPKAGRVGSELAGYQRTGGLAASDFLAEYYDSTLYGGAGGWIYPPQNGYQLKGDGTPIEYHKTLRPGRELDRYGSEYGAFLSPAGAPYSARAIPPSNLDGTPAAGCNYHSYEVIKPFVVEAGPIAAWFAQPGGGLQFQLDAGLVPGAPGAINVLWLVDNGYLERTN